MVPEPYNYRILLLNRKVKMNLLALAFPPASSLCILISLLVEFCHSNNFFMLGNLSKSNKTA